MPERDGDGMRGAGRVGKQVLCSADDVEEEDRDCDECR